MKSRFLRAALVSGLSFTALTSAGAGTVRVTVAEYSAKTGLYFAEAENAFEAANPDIDIQIEMVPWLVLRQKLITNISAGTNPDLSIIGTRWLIDFVKQDVAEPLDGFITAEFRGRFIDPFLSAAVVEGKTYGLPIAASARAMYYNKDLFARVDIAEPPKTWDELKTAAEKISALGDDIHGYGLQGKGTETDIYYYYAMWSQGVEILDENGSSGLASDGAIAAAKIYKELIDKGATQPDVTSFSRQDVENLFKQAKIGMMITAPLLKEEAPKLNYGVAPIPAGPTGARGTHGETDSIIMFKNSQNKEEAWKFLDYLFTTDMRARFTQEENFLPVNKEEAQMDYYVNNAQLKAFIDLLPAARFAPLVPGWEDVAQKTSNALQGIYLGKSEPDAALKAIAEEINGILKK